MSRHSTTVSLELESAPIGIKLVCVLSAIGSIGAFFLSLQLMDLGGSYPALGALFVLLTIGHLVVLYGLWTVRPWAWKWGLIAYGIVVFLNLVQGELVGMLIGIVITIYIATKRDHYRTETGLP